MTNTQIEADIRELDLRSDNSQQSVDKNTQNSESKPKIQKKVRSKKW